MVTTDPASRTRVKRIASMAVGIVVLVLIFAVAIPRFANYGDVVRQLRGMSRTWLAVIAIAEVLNLATYAPNWMVALPGLSYGQSLELTLAGTAVSNVAPLGGPVSMTMQYAMMREWGFERRSASRAMVLTGVWNQFVNLGAPILGLAILTVRGGKNAALMVAAEIGLPLLLVAAGLFVVVLRSPAGADRVGRWFDATRGFFARLLGRPRKQGAGEALKRFRTDSLELLRRRWLALTVATVGGVLTVFVTFVCCVRAVGITGVHITFTEAFAAWAATRLLSAIPLTPGGLGIVDVGLTGALIGFGADKTTAVGAVLLYRVITWLPPIVLGAIAAFTWRRHQRRPV
jgi:putative heme transporter